MFPLEREREGDREEGGTADKGSWWDEGTLSRGARGLACGLES